MNTYAIGDIHGCLYALKTLAACVPLEDRDRIIFLGDYVDRGRDSKGVIDWVLALSDTRPVVSLRGNHEEMMLNARRSPLDARFWTSFGGLETKASYMAPTEDEWMPTIPESHWLFLKSTRNYFETDEFIYVHGAVDPSLPMDQQDSETLLWGRCLQMPPHASGKRVICGHTPQPGGRPGLYEFGVCIDTGAYANGWLTCLNPLTGAYWQANEAGDTREGLMAPLTHRDEE
jgi:serine/threonine protein phosphatase 1